MSGEPRLALQLYTVRHSGIDLARLLSIVADAGYDGVETADLAGVDPARLRAELAANGLAIASAHVALSRLRDDLAATLRYHSEVGTPLLVVPWLDSADRPDSAAGWTALGRELGELAERVAAAGLGLAYHNHDFELADHGGSSGLELLARAGSAGGLGVQLDVGWVAAVGLHPLTLLREFANQVVSVHAKDVTAFGEASWEDVGAGAIEWPPLIAAAHAAGVPWLVVEHDEPADPLASLRASASALRRLIAA